VFALLAGCSGSTAPTSIDIRVGGDCGCTASAYQLLLIEPRSPRPCLRQQSEAAAGALTLPAAVRPGEDLELIVLGRCELPDCVRCEARRRFVAAAGATVDLALTPRDDCRPGDPTVLALPDCDPTAPDAGPPGDLGPDGDLGPVDAVAPDAPPQQQIYTSDAVFVVPDGVTRLTIEAWGGGGGGSAGSSGGSFGGGGGYASATVAVSPGDPLGIKVGQGGQGGAPCTGLGGPGYLPGGNGGPLSDQDLDGNPGGGPAESGGTGGTGGTGAGDGGEGRYGGGGGGGGPDFRQGAGGGGGATAVVDKASQVLVIAGGGGGGGQGLFTAAGDGGAGCALAGGTGTAGSGGGGGGGGCQGHTLKNGSGPQPGNAAAAAGAGLGGDRGTPRVSSCPQMRGGDGRVVVNY